MEFPYPPAKTALDVQQLVLGALVIGGIAVIAASRSARFAPSRRMRLGLGILGALIFACAAAGLVVIGPAIAQAREAARRTNCRCRLKMLGLAMHNHHDRYGAFPAASAGDVPVSWRVKLLPFLDRAALHARYDTTARWDEPANHPVVIETVNTYRCPTDCAVLPPPGPDDPKPASFAMLTGPQTIGGDNVTAAKTADFSDGTSNSIAIIEACGQNLKWAETRDVDIRQLPAAINAPGSKPGESVGWASSRHGPGAHAVFADGAVKFLNQNIDPELLRRLATIDGGEKVGDF